MGLARLLVHLDTLLWGGRDFWCAWLHFWGAGETFGFDWIHFWGVGETLVSYGYTFSGRVRLLVHLNRLLGDRQDDVWCAWIHFWGGERDFGCVWIHF